MSNYFLQRLQDWWRQHGRWLLPALMTLMSVAVVLRLGREFHRLVWEQGRLGAIDLKIYHSQVAGWFSGQPIDERYLYPPASYLMLWPLHGWLSVPAARWVWAATFIGMLVALIWLALRISGAETKWERGFVALLFLSISGTSVAVGNGQLILHILTALLAAVLILNRKRKDLGEDLIVAALLTWTLVKPSVSAPFLWVFVFGWKRWRPALLALVMYSILTLVAVALQKEGLPTLDMVLTKASTAVKRFEGGSRNIHALLIAIGWENWLALSSAAIFVGLGVWTYRYRRAETWVLVAVAALVARMWTYHRVYDDVLILLPELALFRIAKQTSSSNDRTVAGLLVGLTATAMVCPGWLLEGFGRWAWFFTSSQVALWLILLGYLMIHAERNRALR